MLDDEVGIVQNVDACYVQVNMMETNHSNMPWFLDSGASHHVSSEREIFTSLRASSGTRITTTGGQGYNVMGIGNVAIKLPYGVIQKIEHVLYSPGIVKNILSVGFLAARGMSLEFREQNYVIRNTIGTTIATPSRESDSGLYRLSCENLRNCSETLLAKIAKSEPQSMLCIGEWAIFTFTDLED